MISVVARSKLFIGRYLTAEEASMQAMIGRFMADESGATSIEYGLIAVLIAVALITVIQAFGTSLSGTFQKVSDELDSVAGS